MNDEKVRRLYAWFTTNGGTMQDGAYIDHDADIGYLLRAGPDYRPSQPVLHLPRALTFSMLSASGTTVWPETFIQRFKDEPYILTRFMLVDEYLQGSESFWWPYIDMLPNPSEDPAPFNTPLWFNEEDSRWLEETNVAAAARDRDTAWHKEFHDGLLILQQSGYSKEITWLLYKWAATILSSRCFPNEAPKGVVEYQGMNSTAPSLPNRGNRVVLPALCPVLDLLNHDPQARVTWIINDTGFTLMSAEKPAPGDQIYNNYGPKGNEELLMGYGFTIENNNSDSFRLSLPIPDSAQKICAQDMLARGKMLKLKISMAQLDFPKSREASSKIGDTTNVFSLTLNASLPTELVDTLSLVIANERELKAIYAGQEDSNFERNRMQAEAQLLLALIGRYKSLRKAQVKLLEMPANPCQWHAQRYMQGQLNILSHHIRLIRDRLSQKVESHNILGLKDVLSRAPEPIKSSLRSLCRDVLRTRNHDKIRRLGYEEPVFAIFICFVWIHVRTKPQNSGDTGLDGVESDCSDERHSQAKVYGGWQALLQNTYCPPPGFEGRCHGTNCTCKSADSGSATTPWSISNSREELDEEDKLARSAYALVQRALLLKLLEAPFSNEDQWKLEFLKWGLRIWRAEGVSIPIQSTSGEEWVDSQEERLLYLESYSSDHTLKNILREGH